MAMTQIRQARHLLVLLFAGCATQPTAPNAASAATDAATPFPSTYRPQASPPTLIRGATVLTGTGQRLDDSDVLLSGGRIEAVGRSLEAPAGARVIEANGREHPFEIAAFRKYCLVNGLDDIGLTLRHKDKIEAFEKRRLAQQPWLVKTD
jgi:hypothetical protein